jgi:DNA-binding GntR family transcriptional regulator
MPTIVKSRPTKRLSGQIYEMMRKDIIECNLEPGELLEESVITDRYQIGRTPFREACHWLEAEGLLEIVPHRGCFVASFSNKDVNDLFELRLALQTSAFPDIWVLGRQLLTTARPITTNSPTISLSSGAAML